MLKSSILVEMEFKGHSKHIQFFSLLLLTMNLELEQAA
jgi:hypothetical protein